MREYRLYSVGRDNRYSKVHEVIAENDADALAQAKALKQPLKCDLWNGSRFVATIHGHRR